MFQSQTSRPEMFSRFHLHFSTMKSHSFTIVKRILAPVLSGRDISRVIFESPCLSLFPVPCFGVAAVLFTLAWDCPVSCC